MATHIVACSDNFEVTPMVHAIYGSIVLQCLRNTHRGIPPSWPRFVTGGSEKTKFIGRVMGYESINMDLLIGCLIQFPPHDVVIINVCA